MALTVQQLRKEQREERILCTLDELTYATREQLQIIEGLGGDRNAQRILQRMEKDKLISSVRFERKIYYLSNKGKDRIGAGSVQLKKGLVDHTLMRNDLYIKLGMPKDWKKEYPVRWDGDKRIVPDAMFTKNKEFHFVEVDNKQSMKTNYDKIKNYKDLFYAIEDNYDHTPTLIWYSLSEIRKQKLKEACTKAGLKFIVY